MSNDLISRKEAVELVIAEYDRFQANGGSYSGRHELDRVIKMLQNMPTVFDKEKVIEELRQEAMYELGIPEKKFNSDEGEYSSYCSISFSQAKRIVEKGGIEC